MDTQILLAFQAVSITFLSSSIDRYQHGILAALCSFLVYGANLWYDYRSFLISRKTLGFLILHFILLVLSLFANLTLQRRPLLFDIQQPIKPIDQQRTVSVLSRYTLSWATPILSQAIRKGGLDFGDLPFLEARSSVRSLVVCFHSVRTGRLWKRIALAHRRAFLRQWTLTFFHALGALTPSYFMWQLIRVLEKNSANPDGMAVVWLVLLGLAQLVQPWIETWMLWIGWCHIALPVHVQLSGLIVEKSMRKKDVKDRRTMKNGLGKDNIVDRSFPQASHDNVAATEQVDVLKNNQDQINLVSVDAQRISDFLSYNGM